MIGVSMHKPLLVLIAVLVLACSAGIAGAASVQTSTVAQQSVLSDEKTASAAASQTVYGPNGVGDLDFWWKYTATGRPVAYKYVTLKQSKNGGSWTTVTSGYTNGNGYIGWYVKRPFDGSTYRFKTMYGSTSSVIYTIKYVKPPNGVKADFTRTPSVGTKSTNFKFVGSAVGGTPKTWQWTFGDGKTAYGKTVYHKYTSTGYKTVKLNVTFTNGRWASVQWNNCLRVR